MMTTVATNTWSVFLNLLVTTYVIPAMLALLLALITYYTPKVLLIMEKKLGVTVDATNNQAITNAITTYAGKALDGIRGKKYTLDDVKDGHLAADMLAYLNSTVEGAMLHFNKPPQDLTAMMVAKLNPMLSQVEIDAANDAANSAKMLLTQPPSLVPDISNIIGAGMVKKTT